MKSRPEQILQNISKNTNTHYTNDHRSYIYAQCTKNNLKKKDISQKKIMYEETKQ